MTLRSFDKEAQRKLLRTQKKKAGRTIFKILDNGDIFIGGAFYGSFATGVASIGLDANPFVSFGLWAVALIFWFMKHRLEPGAITMSIRNKSFKNVDSLIEFVSAIFFGLAIYLYFQKDLVNGSITLASACSFIILKIKLPEGEFKSWLKKTKEEMYDDLKDTNVR